MVASMHTDEVIRTKLEAALQPSELVVEDDSGRHRGHRGASGGGHFNVRIVAEAFRGMGLVERHRLIYDTLAVEMVGGIIHALALTTLTPEEAAPR
jgi:BolA family transcriptional regulator, general stress-responsive regulator